MDRAGRAVAQWNAQVPGRDHSPMALFGRLMEAALIADRDHLAPVMRGFGLGSGEFDVLATLRRSGGEGGLSPTALFEATMTSSGGMTARLDRLERAGLVVRRPNPDDRRGILVGLTARGRALIESAVAAHLANEERILASLAGGEAAQLSQLLERLIAALQALPPPGTPARR